ncbi:MAG: hypothetical protein V7K77_14815 [Nostoc sp.]|uniref:hypothetical protein n=1 Tax=Nostoc sp. TaxID=1180 RepID=UPI002FF612F4
MMQPFAASPNPAPRLQQGLDVLDRIAQAQGHNSPGTDFGKHTNAVVTLTLTQILGNHSYFGTYP